MKLKLKNAEFPLLMRTHTSDRQVLSQIFIEEEYAPISLSRPRMILDLGANVGYSSAFFLSAYSTARVLAVEPAPDNYGMCCRNLEPFGERSRVLLGAAWPECAKLVLQRGTFRDGREWTTQVKRPNATEASAASAEIDGYDIPTLIGLCEAQEIDLLKIDIERSEIELFSRNTRSWLPKVRNLCIELHGQDCEEVFFSALSGYSYDLTHSGGLTVCLNLRRRH
jgi:FkbM family methyltransferase